jgi:hypothetical protein
MVHGITSQGFLGSDEIVGIEFSISSPRVLDGRRVEVDVPGHHVSLVHEG